MHGKTNVKWLNFPENMKFQQQRLCKNLKSCKKWWNITCSKPEVTLQLDVVWYCFFICRLHTWNWMGAGWQQIAVQRWYGKKFRSEEKEELYFFSFFMPSWQGQGKIYLLTFTCLPSCFQRHSSERRNTQQYL